MNDIPGLILRWIVHAAIFRGMWALPLPWVAVVAAGALLGWWMLRRRRADR
ncbi:hypothetical protein [Microbacterium capsulatum]|uniref:Uncharacterized protein n=1 Tax=Microbacterium capsulatum TaxID=3041921 RepID=A0ABU0XGJ2_9MICO|nr:hypothetical protein [Microbacterium sp. ASV81]MDQ4213300.1 hypothetical protein [Microbacterium sp. ASV81]